MAAAGFHALQRLTAHELLNSLRDVLMLPNAPTLSLPSDAVNESGFRAPGVMAESDARTILAATEAAIAGLDTSTWTALLGFSPATQDDSCAASFMARVGEAAYRRPLLGEETTTLQSVYEGAVSGGSSFADATSLVPEVMPNSPGLLGDRPAYANGLVKLGRS